MGQQQRAETCSLAAAPCGLNLQIRAWIDGPTTYQRLQENPRTASIPTVFITARTQSAETDRFNQMGVAGVIAKPFDPMTLAATARGFLSA